MQGTGRKSEVQFWTSLARDDYQPIEKSSGGHVKLHMASTPTQKDPIATPFRGMWFFYQDQVPSDTEGTCVTTQVSEGGEAVIFCSHFSVLGGNDCIIPKLLTIE